MEKDLKITCQSNIAFEARKRPPRRIKSGSRKLLSEKVDQNDEVYTFIESQEFFKKKLLEVKVQIGEAALGETQLAFLSYGFALLKILLFVFWLSVI